VTVDNLILFNKELSAEEVKELAKQGRSILNFLSPGKGNK
jgi:hypothetical protein